MTKFKEYFFQQFATLKENFNKKYPEYKGVGNEFGLCNAKRAKEFAGKIGPGPLAADEDLVLLPDPHVILSGAVRKFAKADVKYIPLPPGDPCYCIAWDSNGICIMDACY